MAAEALRIGEMTGTGDTLARDGRMARNARQLGLYGGEARRVQTPRPGTRVCAGCRAHEARYGFRDERRAERPQTLCFDCFRLEIARREMVAARQARGWNAEQVALPLHAVLEETHRRRRRAQMAARRALGE